MNIIDKPAKFAYTFVRPARNVVTGKMEPTFRRIVLYAYAWHDHEAQARARLSWAWTGAAVADMEVLHV